jgi:hypothetical protein
VRTRGRHLAPYSPHPATSATLQHYLSKPCPANTGPGSSSAEPAIRVDKTTMASSAPPTVAPAEEPQSDSGKLKTFLGILRRFIGVSDLASVRFSLPSQLLEPTPNLEYWTYIDAPNAFVAIGSSDDPLDRMLEVVRFWLTKDLKYAKGKPCKPYNSCLGEFFRVRYFHTTRCSDRFLT